jgi:glycerophosphoryl diester phosphodiesterase
MKAMRVKILIIILLFTAKLSAQISHSHNDYEQKLPFLAAYNLGFDSIEADLYLKDNEIYVAHDWDKIKPERTFKNLYLNPLLSKIKENNGFPYKDAQSLTLLLDLKKEGREIIKTLSEQLKPFERQLKHVKIVFSGDMPSPVEFKNYDKIFFFDGRKEITYSKKEFKRVAFVSASFLDFGKYWTGKIPIQPETLEKIDLFVKEMHGRGKKVRLWGTPNTELCFETLQKLRVDIIGTDELELLSNFLEMSKVE